MASNYATDDTGAKSVVIKTTGYGVMFTGVKLAISANASKLPPHTILIAKQCLRSICLEESLSDANLKVG
jgi:hypothetical protein